MSAGPFHASFLITWHTTRVWYQRRALTCLCYPVVLQSRYFRKFVCPISRLACKLRNQKYAGLSEHTLPLSRPAYFKSDGPMMGIKMWRPWRQCISPKCLMSHRYPNGPSTKCSRSVATVTYAYRVVGILRDDKQRRNRSHRKSNCKNFNLGKSRLELRTKSQSL